jgi:hypothetical protein
MSLDPPIVVTGGSVTIDFNEGLFPKNTTGKRSNSNKKIRRVEVVDDRGQTLFAQDIPNGKVTVTIHIGS